MKALSRLGIVMAIAVAVIATSLLLCAGMVQTAHAELGVANSVTTQSSSQYYPLEMSWQRGFIGLNLANAKGTRHISTGKLTLVKPDGYYSEFSLRSVKSSNSKVMQAYSSMGDSEGQGVFCVCKKAGKAKLTYVFKGKKHTVTCVVHKYQNPVKSFKVGKKTICFEVQEEDDS